MYFAYTFTNAHAHSHAHPHPTYTYSHIHIYVCICACVCVCIYVFEHTSVYSRWLRLVVKVDGFVCIEIPSIGGPTNHQLTKHHGNPRFFPSFLGGYEVILPIFWGPKTLHFFHGFFGVQRQLIQINIYSDSLRKWDRLDSPNGFQTRSFSTFTM